MWKAVSVAKIHAARVIHTLNERMQVVLVTQLADFRSRTPAGFAERASAKTFTLELTQEVGVETNPDTGDFSLPDAPALQFAPGTSGQCWSG